MREEGDEELEGQEWGEKLITSKVASLFVFYKVKCFGKSKGLDSTFPIVVNNQK